MNPKAPDCSVCSCYDCVLRFKPRIMQNHKRTYTFAIHRFGCILWSGFHARSRSVKGFPLDGLLFVEHVCGLLFHWRRARRAFVNATLEFALPSSHTALRGVCTQNTQVSMHSGRRSGAEQFFLMPPPSARSVFARRTLPSVRPSDRSQIDRRQLIASGMRMRAHKFSDCTLWALLFGAGELNKKSAECIVKNAVQDSSRL